MIMCGRCGKHPAGIAGYGSSFKLFEYKMSNGTKSARTTEFCKECQAELNAWLRDGGYYEQDAVSLPVRRAALYRNWIKCSDRQPEKDGEYLVMINPPPRRTGISDEYRLAATSAMYATDLSEIDEIQFGSEHRPGWYMMHANFYEEDYDYAECDVLCWMPFPNAPEWLDSL